MPPFKGKKCDLEKNLFWCGNAARRGIFSMRWNFFDGKDSLPHGVGIISMEKIFHRRRPRGDFLDGKDLTPRARAREKGELFRWKISVTARAGGGDFYRKSS